MMLVDFQCVTDSKIAAFDKSWAESCSLQKKSCRYLKNTPILNVILSSQLSYANKRYYLFWNIELYKQI